MVGSADVGQSVSLFVDGGYVMACGICGSGGVRQPDATGFTCGVCGSKTAARRCRSCRRVMRFNQLMESAPSSQEVRCNGCGQSSAKWRWRERPVRELGGELNGLFVARHLRHGLPLVDSAKDPDRRIIAGVVRRAEGLRGVASGRAEVVFERSQALLVLGAPLGAEFLVPYSEVTGLTFKPMDVPIAHKVGGYDVKPTLVELRWEHGMVEILYPFALPESSAQWFSVCLERIDAVRGAVASEPAARQGEATEADDPHGLVSSLTQLAALHENGALTFEEFAAAKARLLAGPSSA